MINVDLDFWSIYCILTIARWFTQDSNLGCYFTLFFMMGKVVFKIMIRSLLYIISIVVVVGNLDQDLEVTLE
jgi:hypothetical protein